MWIPHKWLSFFFFFSHPDENVYNTLGVRFLQLLTFIQTNNVHNYISYTTPTLNIKWYEVQKSVGKGR
jgi:hypothetical protein